MKIIQKIRYILQKMKEYFKILNMKNFTKKIIMVSAFLLIGNIFAKALAIGEFLPEKAFILMNPTKILSTSTEEEGDVFYFIVPSDLWIEDTKIIPKDSIIKARITMLKMPVTGVNAAMKLAGETVTFPNGSTYPIKGDVSYQGETQIGGNLTPPLSYRKTLHPRQGEYFNGVVSQYVPSGEYEFGQHITIKPSETLYLILSEDFKPY